ncbi:TetR/AcrR family transcriptional regulator [Alkalihalobacterium alkalinitrilicum]|uniref:TetR/AcrR family transcriptional regulator n=1 Tax=Alkalihalobacterium alkalinitrilicum TaxID=427920 RepID=UPI00099513FF|nr:TetR/AcrR family transcriptional regulator [Alkalihalobacterium alkalinitrilicum]
MSKRLPAEARKKVIIRSAIKVFAKTNYRVTKVADIAELSGVTEPVIYKHFDSKQKLFIEVLTRMGKNTLKLFKVYHQEAHGSLKDQLIHIMKQYLLSLEKYEDELQIFFQAISEVHEVEINQVLTKTYTSYANFFHETIYEKPNDYNETLDYHDIAWEVVGLLIHLSTLYILNLYKEDNAFSMIEEFVERLEL